MAVVNIKINGTKISKEIDDNTILSDLLREKLKEKGWIVEDTPDGSKCYPAWSVYNYFINIFIIYHKTPLRDTNYYI